MVLDLKRKQQQLERDIREEEEQQQSSDEPSRSSRPSARDRIRRLLGLDSSQQQNTSQSQDECGSTDSHPFFISPTALQPVANYVDDQQASGGVILNESLNDENRNFTVPSRDPQPLSVNPPPYASQPQPPIYRPSSQTSSQPTPPPPFTISRYELESRYHPSSSTDAVVPATYYGSSNSISHSHSDYSSHYLGSSSSIFSETGRPPVASSPPPIRSSHDPEDVDHCSTFEEPRPRSPISTISRPDAPNTIITRPNTSKSVLTRPSTSISVRSLPVPNTLERRTSIPGALDESEEIIDKPGTPPISPRAQES